MMEWRPESAAVCVPMSGQVRGGDPSPITAGRERFAYGALLVFIVVLFSNIGVVVPALAPLQPAKLIAIIALLALAFGRLARGAALRLTDPQTILILALLTLAACSVYGALWPGLAARWLMDFGKMVAVYLLIVHVVDRPARLRPVATTIVLCSLVPAVAAIRRSVLDIELIEGSRAAWIGFFEDPNELAFSLVVLIPLTLALFNGTGSRLARLLLVVVAVIQATGVVVTQSRGGLVGLLVVLGLTAWSYKGRAALMTVVAVAAIGAAVSSDALWNRLQFITSYQVDGAIAGRLEAWHVGWLIFLDRWWLGVGIGNFPLAWPLYAASPSGKWITAHNAFIQILGELGVVGLIGFVTLLAITVAGLRRARLASGAGEVREIESFAKGLVVALWGYLSCSLFLSVAFNWFLYLILGLSVSVIAMAPKQAARMAPTPLSGGNGRARPWG
jgi:O-antigen ligase